MGRECDHCNGLNYTPDNPRVFCCVPRPSDPSEMCCVLAGHKNCLARDQPVPSICESGGVATGDQWEEWIESPDAMSKGFAFLSL